MAYRQQGNSLVVSLIILGMITVLGLTSYRLGETSLFVTGNLQHRESVTRAANSVIQEAISTVRMIESPNAIFLKPCGKANTRCVDLNGDNVDDVTVALDPAPTCIQAKVIPVSALDVSDDEDFGCMVGVTQEFGVQGAPSSNSLCANTLFVVTAVATDAITAAQVEVREGVAVRTSADDMDTSCP